ncbi:MAG: hypothetical protein QOH46_4150, partial [Solirubrobacteraceae bacterium]|nr:hypothetical protein [Solirubrobacteraceae bacterium]
FYINVPIGIVALIAAAKILPKDRPQPAHRLDVLGLALLSPGLALLIYGLANTAEAGGFGAAKVLFPALAGAALLVAFVRHALHADEPLVDLRLFRNRTFAAASGTLLLFVISVFGTMLLLPLYLQAVRGESALQSGLLLAPQGLGAMLAMPIAGQLTDRTGIARIVLVGTVLILGATLGLTQIGADTSYWLIGADLFVFGIGMGAAMMPIMSGAMQTLRRAAVARASTALNIIQQVGASIGTAVMSVILTNALVDRLPQGGEGGGGLGAAATVPPDVRERIAPLMADAFAHTFWWALGLLVLAFLAAFLLPWRKPEPVYDPEDDAEAADQPPVLAHI